MTNEFWVRIDRILDEALELASGERVALLETACAGDDALRREVESLLAAHKRSEGFIDVLPFEAAADLFTDPGEQQVLGRSLSHYRVVSSLGAGGMGNVYLALDTRLGRRVALKLLPAHFIRDENRMRRFQQEARAASALNHPSILTVYEIGQHDDLHFIATEFVEGVTLRQRLKSGPLGIAEAADVAAQVAGAVAAAHAAGIIHRDIKPENIMLRPDGLVKVVDFGIAKLTQSRHSTGEGVGPNDVSLHTDTGFVVGTVQYMSPEQLRGQEIDARTDIFSLGIVLYEIVTGTRPFTGETSTDVLIAILEKEPAPLSQSRELDRIVRKALTKDRDQRYQTAAELQADLTGLMRQAASGEERSAPCPSCAVENPIAFGFCGACGTALTKDCPVCRGDVPAANEFCGLCGHRFWGAVRNTSQTGIEPGSPAVNCAPSSTAERRRATVVYSILSGYAAILEQLEPEEVDMLISSMTGAVAEVISRHGGTVDRCSAEQLIALFGVPASSEDDFLRAVHAGLEVHSVIAGFSAEIEARLGQPVRAFTGITSGPVVARLQDNGRCTASGDALQVASRLAAHAEADEILVTSETERMVRPFFRFQPKGPLALKPETKPITVYRVEGETDVHTRLEAAEIVGLTRYTGREEELGVLRSSLERALAGEGRLVTVLGDAGVGKSRLLLELLRTLEQRSISILQSRCHAHGNKTPYLPFIDLIRGLIGLRKDTPDLYASVVSGIKAINPNLESYIPIYLHLLSVQNQDDSLTNDLNGRDLSFSIQEAIAAILTLHTKSGPAVILFEDWHWADEASSDALRRLAGLVAAHPMMIVVTCRPERAIDWAYVEHHTQLNLAPLGKASTISIVESIVGTERLPEGLGELLYQRTGGNPFFIEELCRTLVDDGGVRIVDGLAILDRSLDELHLPETVQAVIRTRLDRLDQRSQLLLRHASVLGREFSLRILERMVVSESAVTPILETLQKQGIIQQVQLVPEPVYRFKHVLTQETAYDSLVLHHRKTLHEIAGTAIEEIHSAQLEEQPELLMFHFGRAENWAKAAQFGLKSAEKASRLSRFAEALATLEQAETWLARLVGGFDSKGMLIDILLGQERVCETLGFRDRQQELINRVMSLLDPSADRSLRADTLVRQGELSTLLGHFDEAESALTEALAIRRELADPIGERVALRNIGFLRWQQGRYDDAVSCNKTALSIDLEHNDSAGYAKDLTNLASVLRSQGKASEALEYVEEALNVDEIVRQPFSHVYTLTVAANASRDVGRPERAREHYERAIELTVQHGLPLHQIIIASALASLCWERGEFAEGVKVSTDLVALTRRLNLRRELAQALAVLSQRLIELNRLDEALPHLRETAGIFEELSEREEQARTLTTIAYVYERCGSDAEAALAAWDNARVLWREQLGQEHELEALEGMARVARNQQGDSAAALDYLTRALEVAERTGDSAKQGSLLNSKGIIEFGRQNYSAALQDYEAALQLFHTSGDVIHVGLMLNSMGVTLSRMGRGEEAIHQLENALEVNQESGQRLLEAHALAALGDVFNETGSPERARQYYAASLEIRREIKDRNGEGWMLHHLGQLMLFQDDAKQARGLLELATAIAAETGDRRLADACGPLLMT